MDHLDIIQTLCRTGLATGSPAVRHQVERLSEALGDCDPRFAASLNRMLKNASRATELRPNRLIRAAQSLAGEILNPSVSMPVDRETSTPLAEVFAPEQLPASPPILPAPLESAINTLLEEWSNIEVLRHGGIEPTMTALIYGLPGTGKTQLALWIAGRLGLPVVVARLDGLISSFLGTTSRNIGSLFAFAQRYRCILLLDEFDSIAKMRDDPQEVGEIKRVVNTLLQNLDIRKRFGPTIAITNHETLLDAAIWRRFDVQIALDRPNVIQRLEIIKRYAPPLDLSVAQMKFIAWVVSNSTGAEIETLLRSLKRAFLITRAGGNFKIIAAVKEYAQLNSGRLDVDRLRLLTVGDIALAKELANNPDTRFDHVELASVFDVHRATIGRWTSQTEDQSPGMMAHAQ